jgi:hypothetical protein
MAVSPDGIRWALSDCEPVLTPATVGWDASDTGSVCVLASGDSRLIWYRGANGPQSAIGFSLSAPATCPGDTNTDCVDVTDLLELLASWGECGP